MNAAKRCGKLRRIRLARERLGISPDKVDQHIRQIKDIRGKTFRKVCAALGA